MVTIYKIERADIKGAGKFLVEFRGLEDDDKPTSIDGGTIENGSTFIEIDTGDVYMYDLENTTWYKTMSGNGGGNEPMEKFDYVIPAGLYEDLAGEITNEDIISVLEEIDDNYLDEDNNVKPLLIGAYLGNHDQEMEGYFTTCIQIGGSGGHVTLSFVSNIDSYKLCYIYYNSSKWNIYYS